MSYDETDPRAVQELELERVTLRDVLHFDSDKRVYEYLREATAGEGDRVVESFGHYGLPDPFLGDLSRAVHEPKKRAIRVRMVDSSLELKYMLENGPVVRNSTESDDVLDETSTLRAFEGVDVFAGASTLRALINTLSVSMHPFDDMDRDFIKSTATRMLYSLTATLGALAYLGIDDSLVLPPETRAQDDGDKAKKEESQYENNVDMLAERFAARIALDRMESLWMKYYKIPANTQRTDEALTIFAENHQQRLVRMAQGVEGTRVDIAFALPLRREVAASYISTAAENLQPRHLRVVDLSATIERMNKG